MFDSREKVLNGIKAMQLPAVFADILGGGGPARFRHQFSAPTRFFDLCEHLSESNPRVENYLPLLELNREAIYAYDTGQGEYVEYYYGDSAASVIGASYQQFVASILVDLGYAGLDSLVVEIAPDLGFKFLDRLLEFLSSESDFDSAEAKKLFVAQLP